MARHFSYYDDWKSPLLKCPFCGWEGTFEEGSVEQYDQLMDSSCPACDVLKTPILAIVSYPTLAESEQNRSKLTDDEKQDIEKWKHRFERWEATCLKSTDQLPELDAPALTLSWDFVKDGSENVTVLRHGDVEIWREPAAYEGYERFREVVELLRRKYGVRLVDVVPTPNSEMYLYGDRASSIGHVEATRRSLKDSSKQP